MSVNKTRFDFQNKKIDVAIEKFFAPRLLKSKLFRKKGVWIIRVEIIGVKKLKEAKPKAKKK